MENNNQQIEHARSNKLRIRQSISDSITVTCLIQKKFDQLAQSVGFSIQPILQRPPIAVLLRADLRKPVEGFLALELLKLSSQLNVDERLNLQKAQIPAVAKALVEFYSTETLEDFVLCFKRGMASFYGKIMRLDAAVLTDWMAQYLDEKYQFVEAEQTRQKVEGIKQDEINYEEFKKRVDKFIAKEKKHDNSTENEYQRKKLENPYKYFTVRNIQIMATSQSHAEFIVQKMIDSGELEEVAHEDQE